MRLFVRLAPLILWLAPVTAQATCAGQDLLAALPAPERAALTAAAEAAPFARGNEWLARRGEDRVVVVGTYHLDDPRHDATLARLLPHLAGATALLVEAGPEEEAALKHRLAKEPQLMLITSGPTLPELLPPETWESLTKALRDRGVPPFMGAKLQPWYLSMLLSVPVCGLDEAAGARGLDGRLIEAAAAQGVPVRALEPYDTVFHIFDRMPQRDQLSMVTSALAMEPQSEDLAATLAASYFAGESRLIWEFLRAQSLTLPGQTPAQVAAEFATMEEVMIAARNRAWVPVIEAAAAEGPVLAAFGALHLSGEEGVLNLLTRAGFTVAPLAD